MRLNLVVVATAGMLLACGSRFEPDATGSAGGQGGSSVGGGGSGGMGGEIPTGPLTVRLDLPTRADLDPSVDPRATRYRVSLREPGGTEPLLSAEFPVVDGTVLALDDAPYITANIRVEVLAQDDRVLGRGVARAQAVNEEGALVFVRKRLVYTADSEGSGVLEEVPRGLSVYDLAPPDSEEPALALPLAEHITNIANVRGVCVTPDGARLVAAGSDEALTQHFIQVYTTADHAEVHRIPLAYSPNEVACLDERRVAIAPADGPPRADVVDLETSEVTSFNFAFAMNWRTASIHKRLGDAADVVVAGWADGVPHVVWLSTVDNTQDSIRLDELDAIGGARQLVDGTIVVGGCTGAEPTREGHLLLVDPSTKAIAKNHSLGATRGNITGISLHADERFVYAWSNFQYPGQTGEGQVVFDLEQGDIPLTSADFAITSAVAEPGGRIIGGNSHFANDRSGELVDLTKPGVAPLEMSLPHFAGHYLQIAMPFGRRL